MKSTAYDYEDIWFQLELNLQTIRREIIKLLEEYQFSDCFECNRLKCCCSDTESSYRSTTLSIATGSSGYINLHELSMGTLYMAAPPAASLPTPEWPMNKSSYGLPTDEESKVTLAEINAWIRASIPLITLSDSRVTFPVPAEILDQVNYSWPPFPGSIWSAEKLIKTIARENRINVVRGRQVQNSVEAFFKHFSKNRTGAKVAGGLCVKGKWM